MNPSLDLNNIETRLLSFIKKESHQAGYQKLVLGVSGGIDSSVVAALCAKSLGATNVLAIMMPYTTSSPKSLEDAQLITKMFEIPSEEHPISDVVDSFFKGKDSPIDPIRKGNVMARARMMQLYDISARDHRLVIGTSNKTEIFLGYGTRYGDTAADIMPLATLYKTVVIRLASHLGIPQNIIDKPPTADLWQGQTDEDELGFTYETADRVLYKLNESTPPNSEDTLHDIDPTTLEKIKTRVRRNAFKQKTPIVPTLLI